MRQAVRFMTELGQEILQTRQTVEQARILQRLFAEIEKGVDVGVHRFREDAFELRSGEHENPFLESGGYVPPNQLPVKILPWLMIRYFRRRRGLR